MAFDFSGTDLQGLLDESWGLDSVVMCTLPSDVDTTCPN
jgi:hypothetical protein